MSAKVSKSVVEVIDVNLMLSIYKYQVHFDITNSSRVSSENFKPSDFKKGSMESMFSRVLQFWSFLVERPCQERENLQSDHILLVQVIVKWFLSLLTLSLSELFAKLTFSLWFLLSTSKKKRINVVKKLQLWDISQSNQCEVSLDVKPEMPTESQLLDDFVVFSKVITYLLTLNGHDYTFPGVPAKSTEERLEAAHERIEQFEVAHEKQSIFVQLQIFLLKFLALCPTVQNTVSWLQM